MSKAVRDLWESAAGRELLARNGVYLDRDAFAAKLRPPADPALIRQLGTAGPYLVSTGQQLYVDYQRAVLRKFSALDELRARGIGGFFLWLDTDRIGADALATGFAWPVFGSKGRISILAPGSRNMETRFAPADEATLCSAMDRLVTYLKQSGERLDGAEERYRALRRLMTRDLPASLGPLHLRVSEFLISQVLGCWPPALCCSRLIDDGALDESVSLMLGQLDRIHAIVGRELAQLADSGVDCGLTPPRDGELPLFATAPDTSRRQRLFRRIRETGTCMESEDGSLSIPCPDGQMRLHDIQTRCHWSPDVFLPVIIHRYVSGFILGRSSLRYWLPMRAVVREVFGIEPVPAWAPLNAPQETAPDAPDSLLYRYMSGERPGSPLSPTGPAQSSPSP